LRARATAFEDGIVAIDTEYARPEQNASHLIVEQGRAAFVDTGVNDSVPLLLEVLERQDLDRAAVDYVFLTHVHLDHAGGAGLLLGHLPNARCVVHPRGAPHMVDPSRLVAGTQAVYGVAKARELYGEIRPVDPARIVEPADGERFRLAGREFEIFYTEGHARHHYCLNDPQSGGVFTGDSFGVSYRALDTAAGPIVFPTTTPVQFDPDEAHRSVDRIMGYAPGQAYLTHYSRVGDLDRLAADMHSGIDDFVAIARAHARDPDRTGKLGAAIFDYFVSRLRSHGFEGDRDTIESILGLDVELNTQGLEVWLDRQARIESRNSS
jgi:glyoxylase-like metal-dependent hydrolase (beta-lactamase superfamily II)